MIGLEESDEILNLTFRANGTVPSNKPSWMIALPDQKMSSASRLFKRQQRENDANRSYSIHEGIVAASELITRVVTPLCLGIQRVTVQQRERMEGKYTQTSFELTRSRVSRTIFATEGVQVLRELLCTRWSKVEVIRYNGGKGLRTFHIIFSNIFSGESQTFGEPDELGIRYKD